MRRLARLDKATRELAKRVNDEHGHAAGDTVLVGVAEVLRRTVRDYDACARWGGRD